MSKKKPFARKRFGQNFLIDQGIVQNIIESAEILPGDHIIEIGPGRGALTEKLLEYEVSVSAIEIDRDLSKSLLERFSLNDRFLLLNEDVLKTNWMQFFKEAVRNLVIANIPYNITTPLFFKFIEFRQYLESITVMVQKELAERVKHNGEGKRLKDYGTLSVISSLVFNTEIVLNVPPSAFNPSPKVDSTVVRLSPREKLIENEEEYFGFVQQAFNHRRKLLINHLKNNEPEIFSRLSKADLSQLVNLRPENLKPDQYFNLFNFGRLGDS